MHTVHRTPNPESSKNFKDEDDYNDDDDDVD